MDAYRDITSRIFGAALNPAGWQDVLEAMGRHLDGAKLHLLGHDLDSGLNLGALAVGHDPDYLQAWFDYYGDLNPYPAAAQGCPAGTVYDIYALVPEPEIRKTEYFNDFLRPQENLTGGAGALLDTAERSVFVIGSLHSQGLREKLDVPTVRLLRDLVPNLLAGWKLSRTVAGLALQDGGVVSGVTGRAIVICDVTGRPRYATGAAEGEMARGTTLRTHPDGRVYLADKGVERIAALMRDSLARGGVAPALTGHICSSGAAIDLLPVPGEDGFAEVLDRSAAMPLGVNGPALIIVVHPMTRAGSRELARTYLTQQGCTPAEIEIAFDLTTGATPAEIAQTRQVSIHTVRTQIKSAMQKCKVNRQTQLVALVARLGG